MDERKIILEIKNLSKKFGEVVALDSLDIQIRQGEWGPLDA